MTKEKHDVMESEEMEHDKMVHYMAGISRAPEIQKINQQEYNQLNIWNKMSKSSHLIKEM